MKYYGTANHFMLICRRGFDLTVAYVCYGLVSGGSLPSVLDSYVRMLTQYVMMMIMGYAVQYVCFMRRKCFVRFSVSLTEPVAHKNYLLCCR